MNRRVLILLKWGVIYIAHTSKQIKRFSIAIKKQNKLLISQIKMEVQMSKEKNKFKGISVTILNGRYHIGSDTDQYILDNKKANRRTYHTTFVGLLKAIQENEIKMSEATDLQTLIFEVRRSALILEEIKDLLLGSIERTQLKT